MNKQEIFDKVVRHLHKQGEPAMDGDNCVYRNDVGLSCAVGCLIPNTLYTPNIENMTACMPQVQAVLRSAGILTGGVEDKEIGELLSELQFSHDHWGKALDDQYLWSDAVEYLEDVMNKFLLTWPEDIPHG